MQAVKRPTFAVKFNFGKVLMAFAFVTVLSTMFATPAFAFGEFESKITDKTSEATDVGIKILQVAAVLSLIVGLAPMLWGQVKVKWLVSCLCACVLFGLASVMVNAFVA